jgi:hypothetical protein
VGFDIGKIDGGKKENKLYSFMPLYGIITYHILGELPCVDL